VGGQTPNGSTSRLATRTELCAWERVSAATISGVTGGPGQRKPGGARSLDSGSPPDTTECELALEVTPYDDRRRTGLEASTATREDVNTSLLC